MFANTIQFVAAATRGSRSLRLAAALTCAAVVTASSASAGLTAGYRGLAGHAGGPGQVAAAGSDVRYGPISNCYQAPYCTSPNWSGYALTGGSRNFTAVGGTFVVPIASAPYLPSSDGFDEAAAWVGIDGWDPTQNFPVQAGTTSRIFANGSTSYWAWYEYGGNAPVTVFNVRAEDSITVAITGSSGDCSWNISLRDTTTGASGGTTASYCATGDSGEWIVEAPTVLSPTKHFATLPAAIATAFDSLSSNGSGFVFVPDTFIIMTENLAPECVPSLPAGSAFAVTCTGVPQVAGV